MKWNIKDEESSSRREKLILSDRQVVWLQSRHLMAWQSNKYFTQQIKKIWKENISSP